MSPRDERLLARALPARRHEHAAGRRPRRTAQIVNIDAKDRAGALLRHPCREARPRQRRKAVLVLDGGDWQATIEVAAEKGPGPLA
jgi:hypothetical protein